MGMDLRKPLILTANTWGGTEGRLNAPIAVKVVYWTPCQEVQVSHR